MGIPRFYAEITKKYNIQLYLLNVLIDYLFIDFNQLIYDAYENIREQSENSNSFERKVINEILRITKDLIQNVVKVKKCVYISIDGPPPRAKMVQQRSRRFKSALFEPKVIQDIKTKLNIKSDDSNLWNSSSNASPGTKFMYKLSTSIKNKIKSGYFGKDIQIIFSDSSIPGEGEHKFMNYIRDMDLKPDENICFYGKDGDLMILAMTTRKNNTYILRPTDLSDVNFNTSIHKYVYLNVDLMKQSIFKDLTENLKKPLPAKLSMENIIQDSVFLYSISGNDFIKHIPYLKVASNGITKLMEFYKTTIPQLNDTLIQYDGNRNTRPKINQKFLIKIFEQITAIENYEMRKYHNKIQKIMNGTITNHQKKQYDSKFDELKSRFQHDPLCSPENPLFEMYADDFRAIDYSKPMHLWKKQYYKYYFNINMEDYNQERTKICIHYLESLLFALFYYYNEPPSWSWYYQYRVTPCMSDVYTTLSKFISDINSFQFEKGQPYTPFQQLMMILPPVSATILPKSMQKIMTTIPFVQYYPIQINIDASAGFKYIYSDALLPLIDEKVLIPEIKKLEKKLGKADTERNTITLEPFIYN